MEDNRKVFLDEQFRQAAVAKDNITKLAIKLSQLILESNDEEVNAILRQWFRDLRELNNRRSQALRDEIDRIGRDNRIDE